MFGIGMPEMILILVVALIVFGPKKLPELVKSMGRALGEFKRATSDLKESIQAETGLDEVRKNLREADQDLKKNMSLTLDAAEEPKKDSAPVAAGQPAPQAPMEQVKQAFQRLNTDAAHPGQKAADGDSAKGPATKPGDDTNA